ncbi:MAG TPA: hypothetical protein VIU82_07780 [Bosea sp. (in: a-proteobacteria)]
MDRSRIETARSTGTEATFPVDLPLDPGTLNERLFDIGLWLSEHHIPHRARVMMEPMDGRIRVSFPDADDASAFRARFQVRLAS